jgi:hypothetical protein
MASGRCKNQSDAYRKAFKCPRTSAASVAVKASALMARGKIRVMIKELSAPIDTKVRKTREEFLNMLEAVTYFDPRKMFDSQGKLLQIQDMPFAERMALAAYAIVEAFNRGKKATGFEDAVQIRVRRKVKFVDRFKFAVTYGKMMGFISDEPPEDDSNALKSLHVVFVNSKGERVDGPAIDRPAREMRVIELQPDPPVVKFAR